MVATHVRCVDVDETFSPVVKSGTIRIVLSLAISRHWHVHQLDVKNAFLHGDLAETIYMHQPPGFRDTEHPDYVCLLQRSLYGLKQAPRAWFQRFAAYITTVGFTLSRYDSSLFIYRQGDYTAFLLLYVDDIVLTASSDRLLQQIIASLHREFSMTDLGALNYFLGISVTRDSSGMFLSQRKYAMEILERAHMVGCNSSRTPVDTESKLGDGGTPVVDPTLYRSLAGSLQYLTFTRPDITYAVQQVCLYMHDPRSSTISLTDWAGCPTYETDPTPGIMFFSSWQQHTLHVPQSVSRGRLRVPVLRPSIRGVPMLLLETCGYFSQFYFVAVLYIVHLVFSMRIKFTKSLNVESSKELWDSLEAKYMAEDASSKKFLVSCIIDKLPPSWKYFKHTLKHLKEELTLVELGSHLRIKESLKVQDSDKPKDNNVAGPLVVNRVEHNNSSWCNDNKGKDKHHDNTRADPNKKAKPTCWKCVKTGHIKRDYKVVNVGNKTNCSGKKGSVDGSSNSLKGYNMFNKSLQSYESLNDGSILHMGNESTTLVHGRGCVDLRTESRVLGTVVRIPDLKLKTLGERGIECIFVGYAEHSKAFKFYVIKPNDLVLINSIIESKDAIFDENRFSLVPRPSLKIPNGTEDIGGSVVPE
ncbi:ribonuclease H-like domain-containing protein [Tanacetum coccineum]